METEDCFTKASAVYVSRRSEVVLVAAMWNHAGMYAEIEDGVGIASREDFDALGEIVADKLAACRFRLNFNYRNMKKSDWPAFRASGLKTMRAFEEQFVRIGLCGENYRTSPWLASSPPFFNESRLEGRSPVGNLYAQAEWLIEFADFFIEVEAKTK